MSSATTLGTKLSQSRVKPYAISCDAGKEAKSEPNDFSYDANKDVKLQPNVIGSGSGCQDEVRAKRHQLRRRKRTKPDPNVISSAAGRDLRHKLRRWERYETRAQRHRHASFRHGKSRH